METVYIILLNYNNYKDTIECVNSIIKYNYFKFIAKIIIVDNMSTDNSYIKLKRLSSENINIIQSGKNGGFAFGNNIGIQTAIIEGADYVLLLNNDTLVSANLLNKLIETSKMYTHNAIISSKILYWPNTQQIWYAGGKVNKRTLRAKHRGVHKKNNIKYDNIMETGYITGCCMFMSKHVVAKLGGLPEEYFMYCEDLDYSLLALQKNIKLVYCGETEIYHKVSASQGGEDSNFSIRMMIRNQFRLVNKYNENTSKTYLKVYYFMYYSYRCLKYCCSGEFRKGILVMQECLHNISLL